MVFVFCILRSDFRLTTLNTFFSEITVLKALIFSSPELKAQDKLTGLRQSVHPSVHTFKHKYFCHHPANHNQISPGASLGLAALGFGPEQIRTHVFMATDSSQRGIMGNM